MKLWCMDCYAIRNVDFHGRCSCCQSSALCIPAPHRPSKEVRTEIAVYEDRIVERLIEVTECRK